MRWYAQVNDSPVDYDVEEEEPDTEPSNIDAMIQELGEVRGSLAPLGFVEYAMAATFVRMC